MRTKYKWLVQMQSEDGQVTQAEYETYWSPDKIPADQVPRSCAAEYTCETRKKHVGLTAVLQEA